MRFVIIAAMLVAAVAALPAEAQKKAKQIQCWTDKNGQRMCGDRVPQEYSGEKRDVMKNGRVIDTIDASRTEDQRVADERKRKAEEERQKAAEYDRALLEMYRSADDITTMRNERLTLIDSRIQAAEKNASDTNKSLTNMRTRAEAAQSKNEPVDEKLAKQIRQFEKSQAESNAALERYHKERDAMQAKFDRDYVRYAELRGLPATTPPPPPPPVKVDAAAPAKPAKPADPKADTPATPATPAKKG